jgi:hypothetical protein
MGGGLHRGGRRMRTSRGSATTTGPQVFENSGADRVGGARSLTVRVDRSLVSRMATCRKAMPLMAETNTSSVRELGLRRLGLNITQRGAKGLQGKSAHHALGGSVGHRLAAARAALGLLVVTVLASEESHLVLSRIVVRKP